MLFFLKYPIFCVEFDGGTRFLWKSSGMLYFGVGNWKILAMVDRAKILFWPEIGHFLTKKYAFFLKIPHFFRRIRWSHSFFVKIKLNALIWPKNPIIDVRKIMIFRHFWQKYGFSFDFSKKLTRPSNSTEKITYF